MKSSVLIGITILMATSLIAVMVQHYRLETEPQHLGKPVSLWIAELSSQDYKVRDNALDAIKTLGSKAVPYLGDELSRSDRLMSKVRLALQKRFPSLPIPTQSRSRLRDGLATILGDMGRMASAAVPALVTAMTDFDSEVSVESRRSLRRIGTSAIHPLAHRLLHDANFLARERSAEVLGELVSGTLNQEILSALISACSDREPGVRKAAINALGQQDSTAGSAIEQMAACLRDTSTEVRREAICALTKSTIEETRLIALIRPLLRDSDLTVRLQAAKGLWERTGDTTNTLPVLVQALGSKSVGWEAALAIGKMGPLAAPAVPKLIEAMHHELVYRPLRTPPSSVLSLGRIGKPAVGPLAEVLREAPTWVKTSAVIALGLIGPDAAAAVPAMMPLLKDKDNELRQAATLTIATVSPEPSQIVPYLVGMIREDDIALSTTALTLLQKIDPATASQFGSE